MSTYAKQCTVIVSHLGFPIDTLNIKFTEDRP